LLGDPQTPPLPTRIGRYRVLDQIGEGGMGRVLLASDDTLRRNVALKTLKRRDRSSRRRFLREARAAARISHPNVCPIFEVGEEGGWPFLAMELLPGETLAARLRREPLSPAEALDVAEDLLAALGALHDAGVVHRDIKPQLFLTPAPSPRLRPGPELPSDVARASGARPHARGSSSGPRATWQADPRPPVDARADLFAAGIVLYEALTGRRPFPGDTAVAALSGTLYEEPPPLVGSPVLVALDTPIRRALAKKPAERYASAREMAEALRGAARAAEAASPGVAREPVAGRQAELAWLEERFAAAAAGAGSVVFVTGERGVGKAPGRGVPAPGANGAEPGHGGGRALLRGAGPRRGLPALLRRARPPAHEPRSRLRLGTPAHLCTQHLCADAGGARA
jgi:serine/threonine-protein kinase